MNRSSQGPRAALNLLWTIPLATLLAIPVFLIGGLELCGVSGCSGGGFGPTDVGRSLSWVSCGVIGLLYFLALAFVPWMRPSSRRFLLTTIIAVLIGSAVAVQYSLALP